MRASISLLVLLLSVCGAQTLSTQTEVRTDSQSTGAAVAAEVSTQLDVSAQLTELRDMVVQLGTTLRYTQDEVKVLEAENAAMKTRLAVSEAEVTNLKMANEATVTELQEHKQELAALKTRLAVTEPEVEDLKMDSAAHEQDLAALKTRLAASETGISDLKVENAAQEVELTAVKTRLAATETDVENLEKEIKAAPKVAFSAGLTNNGYIKAGNTDLNLVFSKVFTNVGQAYSSGSGFFTAPVKGVYYFRFNVMDLLSSSDMYIRLCKNGEQLMRLHEYATDGHSSYLSSGLTLQLEEGDEVNMVLPAGYRLYDSVNNHNTFSGFLLFPL